MSKNRDRQTRQTRQTRQLEKNERGVLLLDFFENIGIIMQGGVVMSNG
jgi:hypothetical protein